MIPCLAKNKMVYAICKSKRYVYMDDSQKENVSFYWEIFKEFAYFFIFLKSKQNTTLIFSNTKSFQKIWIYGLKRNYYTLFTFVSLVKYCIKFLDIFGNFPYRKTWAVENAKTICSFWKVNVHFFGELHIYINIYICARWI